MGLKRTSPVVQFLRLFLNPLGAILLVACIVSVILGDPVDASIIVVIILLGNILNFIQIYHSQNTIEKLRADVAPIASVLRDGVWSERPRRVRSYRVIVSVLRLGIWYQPMHA